MTRKEIIKALRCCNSNDGCRGCPLEMADLPQGTCVDKVLFDAADMLEQDVPPTDMIPKDYHDRCMEMEIERRMLLEGMHKETVAEVCALRDQVHNLMLYLTEALALCPEALKVLEDWHPGLPGYAPEPEEACTACRVGGERE